MTAPLHPATAPSRLSALRAHLSSRSDQQRARSLLIGLTAAGLFALPGTGPAASASATTTDSFSGVAVATAPAAKRHDTRIRLTSSDHTRGYGSKTMIRGQVVTTIRGRTGALRGKPVNLYRKISGTSRWRYLGKDVTQRDRTPTFSFSARSLANAKYRVLFAGNPHFRRSHAVTSVSVYRHISATLQDRSGRFHGRVGPAYAHKIVRLEKRNCATCGWHRTRSAHAGRRGSFNFKVRAPSHGRSFWRVSTPASTKFIRSYSAVFTTRR